MGILLPNNKYWAHAGWVSRAFFDDCLAVADSAEYSEIKSDIMDAIKFYSFTLSYENANNIKMLRLRELIDEVIKNNQKRGPSFFSEPHWYEVYVAKLHELKTTLDDLIQ